MKKQSLFSIATLICASTFISAEYEPNFLEKRFYNPKFIITSTDEYGKTTEYDIRKIRTLLHMGANACLLMKQNTLSYACYFGSAITGLTMFFKDWKGCVGDYIFFMVPDVAAYVYASKNAFSNLSIDDKHNYKNPVISEGDVLVLNATLIDNPKYPEALAHYNESLHSTLSKYRIGIDAGWYAASSLYTGDILPVSFGNGDSEYEQGDREITF